MSLNKKGKIEVDGKLIGKFFESAADAILIIDRSGDILMSNQSSLALFGYEEQELIGRPIEILIPESVRSIHVKHREGFNNNPHKRKMGDGIELSGQRKDGSVFPVEVSLNFVRQGDELYAIAFVVDITFRKMAEQTIRKEKELAQTYFNQALSVFLILDQDLNIVQINKKGSEVLGYSVDKLIGKNWVKEFVPPNQQADLVAVFEKLLSETVSFVEYFEHDIITKTGKRRIIEWYDTLIKVDGVPNSILLSGVDITYRREMESSKTRAMMQGQENERKRVAKELHDGLGQSLSAMNLNLSAIEKDKKVLSTTGKKSLQTLKEILDQTIVEVKSISYDLMPKILESYGLVKALKYLADIINDSGKSKIELQVFGFKERQSAEIEVGLYRMTQELINNALKHSGAHEINVQLVQHENSLVLMVEDNGVGFETMRSISDVSGLGLKNISTRVNSLNGSFYIDSSPGKGTTVTVELPG